MNRRQPLTVLTYNMHKGFAVGTRRFVLDSMRDLIAETGADIVFLQEVHGRVKHLQRRRRHTSYPDRPHFEHVADQAWPHYAYGRNAIYRRGDHGNAILSKYPFSEWENIDISVFPGSRRSILHGVIDIPGSRQRLHTLCLHLGLLERERRIQLKVLTKRIQSHVPHGEPMIIAGDFNDWRSRAERQLHRHLDVDELFVTLQGRHALTFPIWHPMFPVDRIYTRGLSPISCQCFSTGPWRKLSDHAALCGST